MTHDSTIKVTLSLIVDVETDKHPKRTPKKAMKEILVENVMDCMSQWDKDDFESNIDGWEVLTTAKRE